MMILQHLIYYLIDLPIYELTVYCFCHKHLILFYDNFLVYLHFLNDEGYIVDKEEWGLTFSTKNVSPTGLVLESMQENGQQTGQLVITA